MYPIMHKALVDPNSIAEVEVCQDGMSNNGSVRLRDMPFRFTIAHVRREDILASTRRG
jgi:hypothetical protein